MSIRYQVTLTPRQLILLRDALWLTQKVDPKGMDMREIRRLLQKTDGAKAVRTGPPARPLPTIECKPGVFQDPVIYAEEPELPFPGGSIPEEKDEHVDAMSYVADRFRPKKKEKK